MELREQVAAIVGEYEGEYDGEPALPGEALGLADRILAIPEIASALALKLVDKIE